MSDIVLPVHWTSIECPHLSGAPHPANSIQVCMCNPCLSDLCHFLYSCNMYSTSLVQVCMCDPCLSRTLANFSKFQIPFYTAAMREHKVGMLLIPHFAATNREQKLDIHDGPALCGSKTESDMMVPHFAATNREQRVPLYSRTAVWTRKRPKRK